MCLSGCGSGGNLFLKENFGNASYCRGSARGHNCDVDSIHIECGNKVVSSKNDDAEGEGVDDDLGNSVPHDEEGVVHVEEDGDRSCCS